ncbi:MAG: hypothetical protein P8M19_06470 [Crocinitomicaceae bacterium]|nr:hypothetical protein [Crocinitomicaceae bacterium]MDG1658567.1 hypothetical protein [Crocinitomicaceae bacterium]MDG2441294.1 hypothetical protein [Crocinitomicaceae bacterium]
MKKMTFGLTAFFISLSLLALLFKIMHWPGANIGLMIGVAGIAFYSVPMIAMAKARKPS